MYMKRWDVFREKREKFIEYFIFKKTERNRVNSLITSIILQRMLKYLADRFNDAKEQVFIEAQRSFKAFRIQFRVKRLFLKRGAQKGDRQIKTIRK